MPRNLKDLAASVADRLLRVSQDKGRSYQTCITIYGHERLIYRLSISSHLDFYVLKGGMLVIQLAKDIGRSTGDVDFSSVKQQTKEKILTDFDEILSINVEDGLRFDTDRVTIHNIGKENVFQGIRLKTTAFLKRIRIPIKVDIAMSDETKIQAIPFEYPSILNFPSANILAYSPAYVLAEKFQAIIDKEHLNSRVKDYFDLYSLRRKVYIPSVEMREAISNTFSRRLTPIPTCRPRGLSNVFSNDPNKQILWMEYTRNTEYSAIELITAVDDTWTWLEPICQSLADSTPR